MSSNDLGEDCIHPDQNQYWPTHINVYEASVNLTQHTKRTRQKLAAKRQQLQKNNIVKCPDDMIEIDKNVFKTLQSMGYDEIVKAKNFKPKELREKDAQNLTKQQPKEQLEAHAEDGTVEVKVFKPNDLTEKYFQNLPTQHSKEKLEALVEGLRMLILNLTSRNKLLKTMVQTAAEQISSLKDFPIYHLDSKVEETKSKKSKKQKSKPSRAMKFADYINNILSEYLGDQQNKLEKLKCLPANIEDLETYANALVREGYGCIVEKEISINSENNLEAFISMTTDVQSNIKYGITTTPLARRYAFDGDIVRAFVLNANTANNKSTKKSLIVEGESSLSIERDCCANAFVIKIVELNMNSIQSYCIFDIH